MNAAKTKKAPKSIFFFINTTIGCTSKFINYFLYHRMSTKPQLDWECLRVLEFSNLGMCQLDDLTSRNKSSKLWYSSKIEFLSKFIPVMTGSQSLTTLNSDLDPNKTADPHPDIHHIPVL
uniref:Uncharacterized protein n=1 Tax=Romanomermis culicivorax TaxID=13658 RepID=A0A915I514_ROMCU